MTYTEKLLVTFLRNKGNISVHNKINLDYPGCLASDRFLAVTSGRIRPLSMFNPQHAGGGLTASVNLLELDETLNNSWSGQVPGCLALRQYFLQNSSNKRKFKIEADDIVFFFTAC